MVKAVICLDVDDDLGRKTSIRGPVVGEEDNIKAAVALALVDPSDSDVNAIFRAVKLCRELNKKGEECVVATLTGDNTSMLNATNAISKQLDYLLKNYNVDSVYLVSDGLMDESFLPLIASRVSVSGVEVVTVRQAKGLEKTYFLLLEKLKDPQYARMLLGFPGILIALISAAYVFNVPFPYLGFLFGSYLILKGFGVISHIERIVKGFTFSKNIVVNLFVWGVVLLNIIIALIVSYDAYQEAVSKGLGGFSIYIYSLSKFVDVFIFSLVFLISVNAVASFLRGRTETFADFVSLLVLSIVLYIVFFSFSRWYVDVYENYLSFDEFLTISLLALAFGFFIVKVIFYFKKWWVKEKVNVGWEVYDENGVYLGRVVGVGSRSLVVVSPTGRKFEVSYENVNLIDKNQLVVRG